MKYIAMNRFKIILGKEKEFEEVWRTRETYLDEVKGFNEFHLLKGETNEEYTLYSSHSVWDKVKMISSRGPNLNHSRKLIEEPVKKNKPLST